MTNLSSDSHFSGRAQNGVSSGVSGVEISSTTGVAPSRFKPGQPRDHGRFR
jgi:hypothetical protein